MTVSPPDQATVKVFASPQSWIETSAVDQCHQVAALPGVIHVAGMPDLHPGKGAPIGAAITSRVLYPHLVGGDIGCGIAVFPLQLRKLAPERLAKRFPDLDQAVLPEGEAREEIQEMPLDSFDRLVGFGTVGRGNHFVELARVDQVQEADRADRLDLARGDLVLIVHSGSRGLGEQILRSHTETPGSLKVDSYLAEHDYLASTTLRCGGRS